MEFLRKLGSRLGFGSRDEDEERERQSRARQAARSAGRSAPQVSRPSAPQQTFDTSQPLAKAPDVTQPPQKSDNQRRIEELRREVDDRPTPKALQRFTLDANSPYSRLQRLEDGRQEMYADSLRKDEGRRVYGDQQNMYQAMVGGFGELANTVQARGSELPETLIGAYHQSRGNDEALRKSLNIQRDARDRLYQGNDGLLGVGTIYDDANEVANLSAADTAKRMGSGLLDAGSLAVGGAPGAVLKQGAQQGIRSLARGEGARQLGRMSFGGAAGTSAYELGTNPDVTPGSFSAAAAVGGAFGPIAGVGSAALGRGLTKASSGVGNLIGRGSDSAPTPVRNPETPTVPGTTRTPSPEPSAPIGSGIRSTNLVKVADEAPTPAPRPLPETTPDAPPQVPDVTNPIALAKVDDPTLSPVASTPDTTPMANFRDAVDGSALQKTTDEPRINAAADAVQEGQLRTDAGVDAQGNPVMMNDAQRAQELADLGIAPQRGSSPVGANEQTMASARAQDADAQVFRPEAAGEEFRYTDKGTNKELSEVLGSGSLYGKNVIIGSEQPGKPKQIHGTVVSSAGGSVRKATGTMFDGDHYTANGTTVIKDANGVLHEFDNVHITRVESASKPLTREQQFIESFRSRGKTDNTATKDADAQVIRPEGDMSRAIDELSDQFSDDTGLSNAIRNRFSRGEPFNAEIAGERARTNLRQQSDGEVVARFDDNFTVDSPERFVDAQESLKRLDAIRQGDDPVQAERARTAIANIAEAMDQFGHESGVSLNVMKVLYDDMIPEQKVNFWNKRFKKQTGRDLNDAERFRLNELIEEAEPFSQRLQTVRDEAQGLRDGIQSGEIKATPETLTRIGELAEEAFENAKQYNSGFAAAHKFLGDTANASLFDKTLGRTGNAARVSMLSAPSGGLFDIQSTGHTLVSDSNARNIGALIGRIGNKLSGQEGKFEDTFVNPVKMVKAGTKRARQHWGDFAKNRNTTQTPDDYMKNMNRYDLKRGNRVTDFVLRMRTTADALSYGMKEFRLSSLASQKAKQLGLSGDEYKAHVMIDELFPQQDMDRIATLAHAEVNMMHDNLATSAGEILGTATRTMFGDSKGGRVAGQILEAATIPFKRFQGGFIHRTLRDKTFLGNITQLTTAIRRQDDQGVVDAISKGLNNAGERAVLGYGLAAMGVVYNDPEYGPSIRLPGGDRTVSLAITGTMMPSIVSGMAVHDARNSPTGDNFMESYMNETAKAWTGILSAVGTAQIVGGNNWLGDMFTEVDRTARQDGSSEEQASSVMDSISKGVLRGAGQYVNPGAFRDANSLIDNRFKFWGEGAPAADIDVEKYNPDTGNMITDVPRTELNRLVSNIPGISQTMPRSPDRVSRTFLDRAQRANTRSDEQTQELNHQQSVKEMEREMRQQGLPVTRHQLKQAVENGEWGNAIKGYEFELFKNENDPNATNADIRKAEVNLTEAQLQSEGVPLDNNGLRARREEGQYDLVGRGLEHKLSLVEDDPDVPESSKDNIRSEIARNEVYQEGEWDPSFVHAYETRNTSDGGVGVTRWREMMRSGDPEMVEQAQQLAELDQALFDAGVIDTLKYGSASGSGGRGRGSGGGRRMSTNIGTISSPSFNYSPIKAQQASMSAPQSAIPELEKVPNYDDSRLRKISVTRGGRR